MLDSRARHLKLFEQLAASNDASTKAAKGLLVLSSRRSGSSLFCDILSRTGKIGLCEEWFNVHYIGAYLTVMGKSDVNMVEYLTFVAKKTMGGTGVFALHSHCYQLMKQGDVFGITLDDMCFDHVVHISRRDKISQAVSLATAIANGRWRYDEDQSSDGNATVEGCLEALREIKIYGTDYSERFASKINAEYFYEDFSKPGHTKSFNEVLVALGKEPQDHFTTSLKPQRTATSLKLKEQFARYLENQ